MQMGAKHILVDHEHEAQDLIKKLEDGKTFEELIVLLQNKVETLGLLEKE